ncbi:MAG: hypothetical protein HUJ25_04655 [Crocinitomicaceae bacterium]|nr:hypothetical protein [Crocinitomicaceae bacterium]
MKCFSLIITTLLMASVTFSRTNEYIVLSKDNDYLGSLEVVSELKEKTEEVKVESQIKVKKLITIVFSYSLYSKFVHEKLVSNKITTFLNHKQQDEMSTEKAGNTYTFTKNKVRKEVRSFSFCESMMYYNEPKGIPEIYSEFDGVFKSVKFIEKETCYELTNPTNKNVSKYFYAEGILQKAIVKHPLVTLYLYRKVGE